MVIITTDLLAIAVDQLVSSVIGSIVIVVFLGGALDVPKIISYSDGRGGGSVKTILGDVHFCRLVEMAAICRFFHEGGGRPAFVLLIFLR